MINRHYLLLIMFISVTGHTTPPTNTNEPQDPIETLINQQTTQFKTTVDTTQAQHANNLNQLLDQSDQDISRLQNTLEQTKYLKGIKQLSCQTQLCFNATLGLPLQCITPLAAYKAFKKIGLKDWYKKQCKKINPNP